MTLIEKVGTILVVSIIGIVSVLIILVNVEKKLKKKIKNIDRNKDYLVEIQKLSKASPEKILGPLDKIARSFFQEAFKVKKFVGYSELINTFKKQNKTKIVEFGETITPLLYSNKKDKGQVKKLISLLTEIVKSNKIVSKQEQMQIRQEEESKPINILRKINKFRVRKKKPENKEQDRKEN